MGACCSCCDNRRKKSYAYRTELGSALVKELLPRLRSTEENTKVVIIRLKAIVDLDLSGKFPMLNPYVEMKLKHADSIAGEQYQRSSYKPQTLTPKWEPDEKFQFIISDKSSPADILIAVYSFNELAPSSPTPVGAVIVKTKEVNNTEAVLKSLKIIDPSTGKPDGQIVVQIQVKTLAQSMAAEEHTVYQYERWQPAKISWGGTYPGYLLPTDPGAWSTVDGSKFGKELSDVAPPLLDGWIVEKQWYTLANDDDPDGWQYAMDFSSSNWYPTESFGLSVRRRAWRREIQLPEKAKPATTGRRGRKTTDDD